MEYPSTRPGGWHDPDPGRLPAPLRLHHATVRPEWVDYNGHMSEWCYLLVMGDSSDTFFRYLGIDEAYRAAGASLFTVETHIRNLLEVSQGASLTLTLQVLGHDAKRVHLAHQILRQDDGVVATCEQMLLHVDTETGRVCPLPPVLQDRLRRIADAHAVLPRPDWAGHQIELPAQTAGGPGPHREAGATWTSS